MNRPPPYFPQNQLSPPDDKRYKKFKFVVGAILFVATLAIVGIGIGAYYLVVWLMQG
jgi:nitrate reductase NapE component